MRNPKVWTFALSVLAVVAGLWIVSSAEDPVSNPAPVITTHTPHATSPGPFGGLASVGTGGDVVVRARIEGGPELGEDWDMEGETNEFMFEVPEGYHNRTLVVEAEAEDGTTTTMRYPIL